MSRYKHALIVTLATLSVFVAATAPAVAQAVTRAYHTDTSLQRGMIVRLVENSKNKVEALSDKSASKMEGIVVAANDSAVTLSDSDTSKQQVFVATSGRYSVLVSSQNGPIKQNDYITISSLAGIGMKAGAKQSIVVGKALNSFDGKTNISGSSSLKDDSGHNTTVALGLIPVDINISHNPLEKIEVSRVPGLAILQSGAQVIVNKSVDPARLYLSALLLIVVAVISGSILYGGVRSGLVSIGRNPLAKSSIVRGLVQIILVSIIILIIGLVGVYLLLKL